MIDQHWIDRVNCDVRLNCLNETNRESVYWYYINPLCLISTQQKCIKENHRVRLLYWLQEVCASVGFQRQTYYLAQTYIDMALTRTS